MANTILGRVQGASIWVADDSNVITSSSCKWVVFLDSSSSMRPLVGDYITPSDNASSKYAGNVYKITAVNNSGNTSEVTTSGYNNYAFSLKGPTGSGSKIEIGHIFVGGGNTIQFNLSDYSYFRAMLVDDNANTSHTITVYDPAYGLSNGHGFDIDEQCSQMVLEIFRNSFYADPKYYYILQDVGGSVSSAISLRPQGSRPFNELSGTQIAFNNNGNSSIQTSIEYFAILKE